ncbi:MAG: nucleotidyltransferase domain-containing protein, partial [Chloroflexota bacterium]|nr:nucleotidyltransferase domain-containing protein [Chloroflexota bacterium]
MSQLPESITRIDIPFKMLNDICQRYEVSELAVFGSILRKDFRDDSDVDLLVEFKPDAEIGFLTLA